MDPLALGADVVNAGISLLNNRANRNFAREQATTAFNRQVQLMNMQNEYNTPANQMARLVEAGLNPNLAYGQLQNGLSAPSVAAAGNPNTPAPRFDLSNQLLSSQIDLAKAQARNLESGSELNYAQAYQIYQITPVQYDKIKADCNRVLQLMDSESFEAWKNKMLTEAAKDRGLFKFTDENGNDIETDIWNLVQDCNIKQLYANSLEYQSAINLFYSKIGIIQGNEENIRLQNKDLQAFVDVCAEIYNSQASEASYAAAVADMNKEFFGKLGASSDVVKLIYGFLSLLIGGGVRIDKSSHRTVAPRTTNIYN